MEKYPRGMQGPVSIPLLIKPQMVFGEKHSLCCMMGLATMADCGQKPRLSAVMLCLLMGRSFHRKENLHLRSALIQIKNTEGVNDQWCCWRIFQPTEPDVKTSSRSHAAQQGIGVHVRLHTHQTVSPFACYHWYRIICLKVNWISFKPNL